MTEELRCMIALCEVKGIGPSLARALVDTMGSAQEVMRATLKELDEVAGIGPKTIEWLAERDSAYARADKELEFMQRYGIEGFSYKADNYPKRLCQSPDSFPVLYMKGNTNLDSRHVLSIVGTRRPTDEGRENTERIVSELAKLVPDVLIVSGLAYGVDVCAHRASLRTGVPTVGVLAHGLDRLYPAAHRDVAAQMVSCGGLLSEFKSGTKPDAQNFVMRNRVVASLADATLVVESATSGGSLITAEMARKAKRKVLAIPGSLRNEMARGCNALIRDGQAQLVESAADIMKVLGWGDAKVEKQQPVQGELFPAPSNKREQVLYETLLAGGEMSVSDLSVRTQMPISEVNSTLLEMEFGGLVKTLPGNLCRALR